MKIMKITTALETYRMVHGHYPNDPNTTERIGPNVTFDPAAYIPSSEYLYGALSSEINSNGEPYYEFDSDMIHKTSAGHPYFVDPDGSSFGYSTLKAVHSESSGGENPTYDLWSTGGGKRAEDKPHWHKNW